MAGLALRCGITGLSSTLTLNYEILIYNLIQNSKDGLQQTMSYDARCKAAQMTQQRLAETSASPAEKWTRIRRQKNPLRVLRGQHEEETSGRGYQLDASRG
jgi:hypothetical protein